MLFTYFFAITTLVISCKNGCGPPRPLPDIAFLEEGQWRFKGLRENRVKSFGKQVLTFETLK